ncbi:DUF1842 domain-containing protein [uncultured Massilia sp.]|uniref:DUF1842 domain-containing protein n=1 Tax=uncultured Massilia sp. TaxID=169973 RepID=UPI0025FED753|nr:DUF1842 domain-containing protein [uncultured Massilia sp.]
MSNQNAIASAYLVKCVLGNVGLPGAPVASLALVVTPASRKITGYVEITQATQGGNYSGPVQGTMFSTGLGEVTQVAALTGMIHADGPMPIEIPFEAHLAITKDWTGTGGFSYANVHVDHVPLKMISQ